MDRNADLAPWYKAKIKELKLELKNTQRRCGRKIYALRRQIADLEYKLAHLDVTHTDTQPRGYGNF